MRFQWIWLLICSTLFYYTLLPHYLLLLYILILINYFFGIAIEKFNKHRIFIYIFSICTNIFILILFKFFGFLKSLLSDVIKLSYVDNPIKIILPVGLSFLIFSIISYLIEIKRGTIHAERHIGIFAASLLFFPKIMQGPIEKPDSILSQFREGKSLNYNMIAEGSKLILWGFFKKLVVANRLAIYVDAVYGNFEQHSGVSLLVATLLYSFQIYADFSGYTDIALGSAKILGFNLTNNFKRPYFAASVKEFWDRWHISFSIWLRDYLFFPLAVLFAGKVKAPTYLGVSAEKWIFLFAVNITFVVCGIWHGEGLNFLIWGIIFGIYLTVSNWTRGINKKLRKIFHIPRRSKAIKVFNIAFTFILVSFNWIFFRADSASDAFHIIGRIFSHGGDLFFDYQSFVYGLFGIIVLLLVDYLGEKFGSDNLPFKTNHCITEQLLYAGLAIIIILTGVLNSSQFIYFKF